ncbi:MAG: histidine--tRNA ligase [Flavobacteriaceae bacterium]|nr:histidine--tRNA ligase [Flavobacteriaceae bacterium]
MAQKPRIPKGTRDFSAAEVARRQHIIETISGNFERFGFMPIETPSMELSETLMGKYGDEGDRLIFRILNSGDFLKKVDPDLLTNMDSASVSSAISEKALRYDLTVPFARYVVQHQNEIDFPFKRYQIQPVWRADRPQKGRFREFLQCDADVVGSKSLWQEVEFIQLYDCVFTDLGLEHVTIKLNNRKILAGLAESIGASDKFVDFTVALDKLDKIGREKVEEELMLKGISREGIAKLGPVFELEGSIHDKLEGLTQAIGDSQEGLRGLKEMEFILKAITQLGMKSAIIDLDVTLARGLNYYTGTIIEVAPPEGIQLGSIGGGGRYDDLTGVFGLSGVGGVGISFGLDRIYMVMEETGAFPETVQADARAIFINFGEAEALYALKAITGLREAGINCELYPDPVKIGKQMNYANKRQIPFVIMAGEAEMADQEFTIKDMSTGDQWKADFEALSKRLK